MHHHQQSREAARAAHIWRRQRAMSADYETDEPEPEPEPEPEQRVEDMVIPPDLKERMSAAISRNRTLRERAGLEDLPTDIFRRAASQGGLEGLERLTELAEQQNVRLEPVYGSALPPETVEQIRQMQEFQPQPFRPGIDNRPPRPTLHEAIERGDWDRVNEILSERDLGPVHAPGPPRLPPAITPDELPGLTAPVTVQHMRTWAKQADEKEDKERSNNQ